METDKEQELLRSVALKNASSILAARARAERELVTAKEALRETAERLKLALDAGHLGDWSWDAGTDEVTLSAGAAGIFGLAHAQSCSWTALHQFLHEEDRERARMAVERCLRERSDYDIEYRANQSSGNQLWVAARGRVTCAKDGTIAGMIGVVQDITERKQLLEREQAARVHAERMSELKEEFLATLSHELRTPLSAILGWAQLLRRRPEADEELQRAAEVIERNARVQTRLIEDLLDTARIASGQVRIDVQSVRPASFIEAALETVRPAAEAKGIRVQSVLDPTAGPISGDPARLQQVVWNLLSNAIKFTPKGGLVQVLLERINSQVEISVADTGIGIRPEFIGHVFDRFRQADSSSTRRQGGLGLGLAIAKQLVELHGGTLRAESEGEGRGATFIVHLPITVVHRSPSDVREHPTVSAGELRTFESPDLSGVRVLVVDDQQDARVLIKRVLEDGGAEVITAGGVSEAVALAQSERPHLVVTDIGMPEADGFDLLNQLRALGPERGGNVPAIALTAFARPEDRIRALGAGFRVHMAKPVEPRELVVTVANVAGRVRHA